MAVQGTVSPLLALSFSACSRKRRKDRPGEFLGQLEHLPGQRFLLSIRYQHPPGGLVKTRIAGHAPAGPVWWAWVAPEALPV